MIDFDPGFNGEAQSSTRRTIYAVHFKAPSFLTKYWRFAQPELSAGEEEVGGGEGVGMCCSLNGLGPQI